MGIASPLADRQLHQAVGWNGRQGKRKAKDKQELSESLLPSAPVLSLPSLAAMRTLALVLALAASFPNSVFLSLSFNHLNLKQMS